LMITIGWPRIGSAPRASVLAKISDALPGPVCTINSMGLVGQTLSAAPAAITEAITQAVIVTKRNGMANILFQNIFGILPKASLFRMLFTMKSFIYSRIAGKIVLRQDKADARPTSRVRDRLAAQYRHAGDNHSFATAEGQLGRIADFISV